MKIVPPHHKARSKVVLFLILQCYFNFFFLQNMKLRNTHNMGPLKIIFKKRTEQSINASKCLQHRNFNSNKEKKKI